MVAVKLRTHRPEGIHLGQNVGAPQLLDRIGNDCSDGVVDTVCHAVKPLGVRAGVIHYSSPAFGG